MRCKNCTCSLPICAGEKHPELCDLDPSAFHQKSVWYSSVEAGWPSRLPSSMKMDHSKQLVIARFNEDVSWVQDVNIPSVVYNKGKPLEVAVSLPNVGREGQTYLHHIVQNYNRLADVTIFTQADPFAHALDFLGRIACKFQEPTSLSARYSETWPIDAVKALDLIQEHEGFPIRLGIADGYERLYGEGHPVQSDGSMLTHTSAWLDKIWGLVFACKRPDPIYFGYGALWAVPRSFITSRPLSAWKRLLAEVERPGTILSAYALEVLFKYIFDDPVLFPMIDEKKAATKAGCRSCGGKRR